MNGCLLDAWRRGLPENGHLLLHRPDKLTCVLIFSIFQSLHWFLERNLLLQWPVSTVLGCDRDRLLLRAAHGWGNVDALRKRYVQFAYWHALCAPFRNQDKNHIATKWTNQLIIVKNDTKRGNFLRRCYCVRERGEQRETQRGVRLFSSLFF